MKIIFERIFGKPNLQIAIQLSAVEVIKLLKFYEPIREINCPTQVGDIDVTVYCDDHKLRGVFEEISNLISLSEKITKRNYSTKKIFEVPEL